MLSWQDRLGRSGGFGASSPVFRDGHMTCSTTICYGNDGGATDALFKKAQDLLNRVGVKIFGSRWTAIKVDGFVGAGTYTAATKVFPLVPGIVGLGRQSPQDYVSLAKLFAYEPRVMAALADFLAPQMGPVPAPPLTPRPLPLPGGGTTAPPPGTVTTAPPAPLPAPTGATSPPATLPPAASPEIVPPAPQPPSSNRKALVIGSIVVGVLALGGVVYAVRRARRG